MKTKPHSLCCYQARLIVSKRLKEDMKSHIKSIMIKAMLKTMINHVYHVTPNPVKSL